MHKFPEDTFEGKLVMVQKLMDEENQAKKDLKLKAESIHLLTKRTIEELDEDTSLLLLEYKWIQPLLENLCTIPEAVIADFVEKIMYLSNKYEVTMLDVDADIKKFGMKLSMMINELVGSSADMDGLAELRRILEV